MDESLRAQIETYLSHLDGLIRRGRQLRDTLATGAGSTWSPPENGPSSKSAIVATRVWQEDCGVTINQLSGGSKAHWLARSFSEAFLMRSAAGSAVEGAAPADFVHNLELRPVVEQAYTDSRRALEQQQYDLALLTSCGILEAIVTDALEHKGLGALTTSDTPAGKISDWPFEARLAVAERTGLIRSGCARLPLVARTYRNLTDANGESHSKATVSESDARRTGQVLHVVMRDLDPGR